MVIRNTVLGMVWVTGFGSPFALRITVVGMVWVTGFCSPLALRITVIGVVSYAYIGAQMARDVLNLAQLEQARRGSFSAAASDEGDEMVEPPDL